MPVAWEKLADAPAPSCSAGPTGPPPASVVTTPDGVILRILLPYPSVTKTFPDASTAIPLGLLKLAAAPVPSCPIGSPPIAPPASVVTTPAGVILRILLFIVSATKTVPYWSTAMPWGLLKLAAVPVPSWPIPAPPPMPPPASVVTTPLGVILRILLFIVSATKTVPYWSTAMPLGLLKLAAAPVPSCPIPAPP